MIMYAYQIKANGVWTGGAMLVMQSGGLAPGWVRASPPPSLLAGQCAVFVGDGWIVSDTEPPVITPPSQGSAPITAYTAPYAGAVERTLANKGRDVVSVKDFGSIGNGVANDLAAIQAAFNCGGTIHLAPGESYFGNSGTVKITKPVRVVGHGASFVDILFGGKSAAAVEMVTFEDVKFSTQKTPSSSQLPPYVINVRNVDYLSLSRCIFDGVLVYVGSDDRQNHYGFTARDCVFRIDGTSWAWTTLQLDQLTIDGYRHPTVENNKFFAKNVNRVLKISAGLTVPETPPGNPVPTYNTRAITVRNNAVIASCDQINGLPGGKQVVDCFLGTTESTFEGNYFACYGFNRCLENKTGYTYDDPNVVTSHKILNNRFYLDCAAVFFQGAYGLTSYPPNSRDTLDIAGNTYRITGDKNGTVHVRFMHLLTVGPGEDASVTTPVADKTHYDISSCEEIKFIGLNAKGGTVLVGNAMSNAQADTFDAPARRITLQGVSITDWGSGQTVDAAAILVGNCVGLESLVITGCHSATPHDNAKMTAAFSTKNCTVRNLTAIGNVATHGAAPAKETMLRTTTTVTGRLTEIGNSWGP